MNQLKFSHIMQQADLLAALLFACMAYAAAGRQASLWDSIEWTVLMQLLSLMLILSGLRRNGIFSVFCAFFLSRCTRMREVAFFFVNACFFLSMAVTNDAALLMIVPETISVCFRYGNARAMMQILILETAAANLGSMATPFGNPQNLFLYNRYALNPSSFFEITLPLTVLGGILTMISLYWIHNDPVRSQPVLESRPFLTGQNFVWLLLLAGAMASVFRIIPAAFFFPVCLAAVCIINIRLFKETDYKLLLLFLLLFSAVGNMEKIPGFREWAAQLLHGSELGTAILISQVVSNVPAAVLLSAYTEKSVALVAGTNIGGLGTIIASMASLISFRFYASLSGAQRIRYLWNFTKINAFFMAVLYPAAVLWIYFLS